MHRSLAVALTIALLLVASAAGAAEEVPPETADGAADCRALLEKTELEIKAYEKKQPPVPYVHPRRTTIINAPWGKLFEGLGDSGGLIPATLLPHLGAQARAGSPAILVSWPWSVLVIGPMYACSRTPGSYEVDGHRIHRFLVEPGFNSGKGGTGFHTRLGYRFVWHRSSWPVGPGFGLGSTLELVGNREPFRYSFSPEAIAHFGNCCASSYFTLAIRYDHYFKGTNQDIIGGSLGYTFF